MKSPQINQVPILSFRFAFNNLAVKAELWDISHEANSDSTVSIVVQHLLIQKKETIKIC